MRASQALAPPHPLEDQPDPELEELVRSLALLEGYRPSADRAADAARLTFALGALADRPTPARAQVLLEGLRSGAFDGVKARGALSCRSLAVRTLLGFGFPAALEVPLEAVEDYRLEEDLSRRRYLSALRRTVSPRKALALAACAAGAGAGASVVAGVPFLLRLFPREIGHGWSGAVLATLLCTAAIGWLAVRPRRGAWYERALLAVTGVGLLVFASTPTLVLPGLCLLLAAYLHRTRPREVQSSPVAPRPGPRGQA